MLFFPLDMNVKKFVLQQMHVRRTLFSLTLLIYDLFNEFRFP